MEERSGLDLLSAIDDTVERALQGASCPASSLLSLYLPLVAAGAAAPPPPEPVPPQVTIVEVAADPPGIDLDGEYVRLRNDGLATVSMTGWTLRDAANTVYTFPAFSLAAGAEVQVWVKAGVDDAANLYWGRGSAVWNNTGDTAILRDASGNEVARFSYT